MSFNNNRSSFDNVLSTNEPSSTSTPRTNTLVFSSSNNGSPSVVPLSPGVGNNNQQQQFSQITNSPLLMSQRRNNSSNNVASFSIRAGGGVTLSNNNNNTGTSSVLAAINNGQPLPPISAFIPAQRRFSATSIDMNSDATEMTRNSAPTPVDKDTFSESDSMGRPVQVQHHQHHQNNHKDKPSFSNHLSMSSSKINESLSVTARALNLDERRKFMNSGGGDSNGTTRETSVQTTTTITNISKQKLQLQQHDNKRNQLPETARGLPPKPITNKNESQTARKNPTKSNNNTDSSNQSTVSHPNSRISSADSKTSSERNARQEESRLLRLTDTERKNHYDFLKQEMATMKEMRKQGRRLSHIVHFQQQQQLEAVKTFLATSTANNNNNNSKDQENPGTEDVLHHRHKKSSNEKIDSASLLPPEHDRQRMSELTQERIQKQKDQLHEMLGKFQETLQLNTGLAYMDRSMNHNNSRQTSPISNTMNNIINSPLHQPRTKTEEMLNSLSHPELILLPEVEARLKKEEETRRKLTNQLQNIIVSGRGAGGGKITAAARKQVSDHVQRKKSPQMTPTRNVDNNKNRSNSPLSDTSVKNEASLSSRRNKYSVGGSTFQSDKILSGTGGQKAHQEVRDKIRARRAELEAEEPELRVQMAKRYVDEIDEVKADTERRKEMRKLNNKKNSSNIANQTNTDDNKEHGDDEDPEDFTFMTTTKNNNNQKSKNKNNTNNNNKINSPGLGSSTRTKAPSPMAESFNSLYENDTQREIAEKTKLLNRLKELRDDKNQPLFFTLVPHRCAGGGEVTQLIPKISRDSILAREIRRQVDKDGPARVTEVHATTGISARGDAEAEKVRERKHDLMKHRIDDINTRIDQKEKAATLTGANAQTVVKKFSEWICASQAARRFAEVIAAKWQPFDGDARANAAFHPPYTPQRLKELADASQMIQRHMFRYRVRCYFDQRGQAARNILLAMRHVVRHMRWRWAVHQFLARVVVVQRTMRARYLRRRGRLVLWRLQWQRIEPLLLRLTNLYRDPDIRQVLGKAPFDNLLKDGTPVIQNQGMTERGSLVVSKKLREMKRLEELNRSLVTGAAALLQHLITMQQQQQQALNTSNGGGIDDNNANNNNNNNNNGNYNSSISTMRLVPMPDKEVRDQIRHMWNTATEQVRHDCDWYFQKRKTRSALQTAMRKSRKDSVASGSNLNSSKSFVANGSSNNYENNSSRGDTAGDDFKDLPLLPLFLPFDEVVNRIVDMQKDAWLLVRSNTNVSKPSQSNTINNNNNEGSEANNTEASLFGTAYEASNYYSYPGANNNNNYNNNINDDDEFNSSPLPVNNFANFASASAVYQNEHLTISNLVNTKSGNFGNNNNNNQPLLRQQQKPSFRSFSIVGPSGLGGNSLGKEASALFSSSPQANNNNNNSSNRLARHASFAGGGLTASLSPPSNNNTIPRRRSFMGSSSLVSGSK